MFRKSRLARSNYVGNRVKVGKSKADYLAEQNFGQFPKTLAATSVIVPQRYAQRQKRENEKKEEEADGRKGWGVFCALNVTTRIHTLFLSQTS